jgi:glyoxylase-like metal-dependent hydrolase (beta-lactamase superfamily II)/rhodanese-related sulfurtransferase
VLIDPVLEHMNDYMRILDEKDVRLKAVIDTHTHADHISGGSALKDLTGCRYVMYGDAPAGCVDMRITGDATEELLPGVPFRFTHTPGHTECAMSIVVGDALFTGDTLFLDEGGAGRDDLRGGDPGAHWESLQKLMALPDHLVVMPAHDYRGNEPSSLAEQKENNPHLRPRTKEEYIDYSRSFQIGPADWMDDVLRANYACAKDPSAAWIPMDVPACEVKGSMDPSINEIEVSVITPQELEPLYAEPPDDLLLFDVREREELDDDLAALDGIMSIPLLELTGRLTELGKYRDRDIIVICRNGNRSHTACQIMTMAGFERVRSLEHGVRGWKSMFAEKGREWPPAR